MRDLVLEDDPILRKRCQLFDFDNPQEDPIKLTEELLNAMEKYEGMGLSACQIGVDLKVFVMRFNGDAIACFNPRINHYSEETTYTREGCLSYPGLFFPVIGVCRINFNCLAFSERPQHANYYRYAATFEGQSVLQLTLYLEH